MSLLPKYYIYCTEFNPTAGRLYIIGDQMNYKTIKLTKCKKKWVDFHLEVVVQFIIWGEKCSHPSGINHLWCSQPPVLGYIVHFLCQNQISYLSHIYKYKSNTNQKSELAFVGCRLYSVRERLLG